MPTKEQNYIIEIRGKTDQAVKEIRKLQNSVKKLEKQNKSLGNSSKSIDQTTRSFSSLTTHVAKLAAIYASFSTGQAFVRTMSDLEQGTIGMAKTTGLAGDALVKFDKELQNLSVTMKGIKYSELQEIATIAGQLGISGEKDILIFTQAVAEISVATNRTAEETATDFAILSNSLREPIENVQKLGDAVNELSDNSTATVHDVLHFTKRVAAAGKEFGLASHEVLAFGATLRDVGSTAESGGSALSRLMRKLTSETITATDAGKEFARVSGKSFADFAKIVRAEPIEALKLLLKGFNDLNADEKALAMDEFEISSSEMRATIGLLSGGFEKLNKNLATSKRGFEEGVSTHNEYIKASKSLAAAYDDFNGALELLVVTMSKDLLPVIKDSIEGMNEFILGLDKEDIETFAEAISGMVEALGDLGAGLVKLGSFINDVLNDLSNFTGLGKDTIAMLAIFAPKIYSVGKALSNLKIVTTGAGIALAGLSAPILAIGVAITAVVVAFNMYSNEVEDLKQSTIQFEEAVGRSYLALGKLQVAAEDLTLDNVAQAHADGKKAIEDTTQAIADINAKMEEERSELAVSTEDLKRWAELRTQLEENLVKLKETYGKTTEKLKELGTTEDEINTNRTESIEKLEKLKVAEEELAKVREKSGKESLKAQKGYWKARFLNSTNIIKILVANEKYLVDEVKRARDVLAKVSKSRVDAEVETSKAIMALYPQEVLSYRDQNSVKTEITELGRKAREAAEKGEFENSKSYNTQRKKLIVEFGKKYQEVHDGTQSLQYDALKMLDRVKIDEKELADIRVEHAKADLADKESQLKTTREVIDEQEALKDKIQEIISLLTDNTDTQFKVETTEAFAELQKLETKIKEPQEPIKVTADVTQAEAEIKSISVDRNTSIKVDVDDNEAKVKLESLNSVVTESTHHVKAKEAVDKADVILEELNVKETESVHIVIPETESIDDKITELDDTVTESEHDVLPKQPLTILSILSDLDRTTTDSDHNVVAKTKLVNEELRRLDNTVTTSKHNINVDSSAVDNTLRRLDSTVTTSVHYIHVYTVYHYSQGGGIPHLATGGKVDDVLHLASGGFTRKTGKLPGHDTAGKDDVRAMLTRGEYVSDVATVDHYGDDFFRKLKARMIPKYATGGIAGADPSSGASGSSNTTNRNVNLNLTLGDKQYNMVTEEAVAVALEKHLRKFS